MSTYKIANKVKGIIRSYASGPIGNQLATYANEPFMRIEEIEAILTFNTFDSMEKILAAKNRVSAGVTAPPTGLFLYEIKS